MAARARKGSAALATLLLVLQGAGIAHEVLTVHSVCLEHGDYLEGEHADSVGTRRPAEQGPAFEGEQPDAPGAPHDHCEALTSRRTAVAPSGGTVVFTGNSLNAAVAAVLPVTTPAIAVLRLAPKGSPPA